MTPRGQRAHGQSPTPVDLLAAYTPPVVPRVPAPATLFAYNVDRQLTQTTRPDGLLVGGAYDSAGSNVPEYLVRAAWRADSDAWRNRTLVAGAADWIPFGFAGGMSDHETGLTRFGARDYDPLVGRWTSKDPAFFETWDPALYVHARNSPAHLVDRDGMLPHVGDTECENCTSDREGEYEVCVHFCHEKHGSAPASNSPLKDCLKACDEKFTKDFKQKCGKVCDGKPEKGAKKKKGQPACVGN